MMAGDSAGRDARSAGGALPEASARRARLAQQRRALGLTQEALANLLGVDRSTVARWERGETEPAPWTRPRLARAMQTSVEELPGLLARGAPPGQTLPGKAVPDIALPDKAVPDTALPDKGVPDKAVADKTVPDKAPDKAPTGKVVAGSVVPGSTARVPRLLPVAVAGFTGRSIELAALSGVLEEADGQRPGVVVISATGGTPGVGTTALALHWAHQAADRFPDGQLYADLRGSCTARGPAAADEVIRGFLRVLGVTPDRIPPAPGARADLYRSLLAGRRMLLVLDDAADEHQVRSLLPASPASLVLVTSRDPLGGLAADASGPLTSARFITLDTLTHGEAVELLTARIGRARAEAEPDSVAEIAGLCGRLPLALTITAARAAQQEVPLAAVAQELRAGRQAAGVYTALSWSYQQLSEAAARMFRLLGVHPGPDITVPAAASLAATDAADARRLLSDLADLRLITEHVPGRYALHDLLRGYAVHQAGNTDSEANRRAAVGRLLDHYLYTADLACSLIASPPSRIAVSPPAPGTLPERIEDSRQALAWFEAERPVLLAAVALAGQSRFDVHAWQLPRTMMPFLASRGHHLEWAATQRTGLSAATRLGNAAAQAAAARFLAFACNALAEYDQAARYFSDSIATCQRLGDRRGEASAHHGLCLVAERQGRYADALDHAAQAFRLYQETGSETGGIDMINAIGWHRALLGDYDRARASCWQALRLSVGAGYLVGQENAWNSLGYVEHRLGNFGAAIACYKRALEMCRRRGNRTDEATCLSRLGEARLALGEPARAGEAWRQAVAILDDLGHPDAAKVRAKLESAELATARLDGMTAGAPA